jgi:RNA polymerase subunit RPABC4/transcription elongation factor Spt4/preprotein translocase subunit SecG
MSVYTCGRCGKMVDRSTQICPHCGARLNAVRCKYCGFLGSEADFVGDRCPQCHAALSNRVSYLKCPACHRALPLGRWICAYCGRVAWEQISLLGLASILLLIMAIFMIRKPAGLQWLAGMASAVCFFLAADGLRDALDMRRTTFFVASLFLFLGLALGGLSIRQRYFPSMAINVSELPIIPPTRTPTDTPTPPVTETPLHTSTPVISPTPGIMAIVQKAAVNVRLSPSTDSPVIDGLVQNDEVTVLGRSSDSAWLRVQTPKGNSGWVFAQLLSVDVPLSNLRIVTPAPTP